MPKLHSASLISVLICAFTLGTIAQEEPEFQWLVQGYLHLGNDETPEWPEAAATPDALNEFIYTFENEFGTGESALSFITRDAHQPWEISINDKLICKLTHTNTPTEFTVPIEEGILNDGLNTLKIFYETAGDDFTIGAIKIYKKSYSQLFDLRTIEFNCYEETNVSPDKSKPGILEAPVPCRISITKKNGERAKAHFINNTKFPTRDGVVYTNLKGYAKITLEKGDYIVTASRGAEYSIDQANIDLTKSQNAKQNFYITKEVNTAGWLSADTHIHTLTHSGHGDANMDERILTLAGDHTEIAISTDHDKQIDYKPTMRKHGVRHQYINIIGNEVSTPIGHFNAFPLPGNGPVPDSKITNWDALDQEIREKGAEVIILNHPRWPSYEKGPFGVEGLSENGTFDSGIDLKINVIELINSDDEASPFDISIKDWFAILNTGKKIFAAGSSDSHEVYVPTSYGRTWVKSKTDFVHLAKLEDIYTNIRDGHSSAALGLFGEVTINEKGPGETIKQNGNALILKCRLAHASWANVHTMEVYINGEIFKKINIKGTEGPFDETFEINLKDINEDSWVTCIAYGARPTGYWWACEFPELYFASNPIFIKP